MYYEALDSFCSNYTIKVVSMLNLSLNNQLKWKERSCIAQLHYCIPGCIKLKIRMFSQYHMSTHYNLRKLYSILVLLTKL